MSQKILLVDDDPNILQGFRRSLRKRFQFSVALGGPEGLDILEDEGPFAVVVSDMQMPEMDGIEFLRAVQKQSPDSVRMMLTGNGDQKTAMDAVNDGQIFRFLTKPCSPERLTMALEAGIEQYRLINAERELLSKTLSGSVSILTEVLSLVNPMAFGHATKIRRLVKQVCQKLPLAKPWEVEVAAMLCHVGCVTIPEATMEKWSHGGELSQEEIREFQQHPKVGYDLISKIPRLNGVAEIIAYQQKCFDGSGLPEDKKRGNEIPIGARILKLVIDAVQVISAEKSTETALGIIRDRQGEYDPQLVEILADVLGAKCLIRSVQIDELDEGMVLNEHVVTYGGEILIARGRDVTLAMRERLKRFSQTERGVRQPIQVRCTIRVSDKNSPPTWQSPVSADTETIEA